MTAREIRKSAGFMPSRTEELALTILQRMRPERLKSIGISTAGYFERVMAERGTEVVATTLEKEALEYTQAIVGGLPNLELRQEDARKVMPEADATYDVIYSRLCLHYLSDHELRDALAEFHRVLKPGGTFIIVVKSLEDWTAKTAGARFDRTTGLTYTPAIERYQNQYRRLHSRESINCALANAGLRASCIEEVEELIAEDFARKIPEPQPAKLIQVMGTNG